MNENYDVIVVGGGHAGIEACLAPARMGLRTLLVTTAIKKIGFMPCNPAIGGPAKGIVVREIDALGGEMARNTDKSYVQMRMLNTSKGPAVRALRAQADKIKYPEEIQKTVLAQENLDVLEDGVGALVTQDHEIRGVRLDSGRLVHSKAVILTTGTYMTSKIMISDEVTPSGPEGSATSSTLSDCLRELGFDLFRLKTGTPPRVDAKTVDVTGLEVHSGDDQPLAFSFDTTAFLPLEDQLPCYLTYTNEKTHAIIQANLDKSSMYSGVVSGVGPRYCPSIEDKLVRFHDKPRHQIFLEPEARYLDEIYVQGFSTSLPRDVQEEMLHSIKGLEQAKIIRHGYAIEYDAIKPIQLWPTLETKLISGLYTAGQINGTSGYEEAAGQGLMAGINAVLKIRGEDPLILARDEAYIGVMIDDLVTKGTLEPYRLLTSRAEFRLLLRHDNADVRLTEYGKRVGLVSDDKYAKLTKKLAGIEAEKKRLSEIRITPKAGVNDFLEKVGSAPLKDGVLAIDLLKRPELTYAHLLTLMNEVSTVTDEIAEQVEIMVKYDGYIAKAIQQAQKMKKMDERKIPADIDYDEVPNLALEAVQKLKDVRPLTMGQAARISGVNPADLQVLMIYMDARRRRS
ncbi:MAG: tRNA uridine-5-carboxymethylaminomethyl(34) synthesis enzyme MnmG [Defluviitaleaceae bacterium]|nr:tRNA uridine-5-carboxymethylaminomethyl(34) synthesis enzyme MnmG [Defluviitaleaceae bacterium]